MKNLEKMQNVIRELREEFAERDELIEYLAIALLTKNNLFILGEPGQAKSKLIDTFRKRITGAKQFKTSLNKETDEEMLFGRIDLPSLLNGKTTMITDGKIPDSDIVFLDELFKASGGILNSLLTALNEREYTNEGQLMDIPTISFFSASNEIPDFKDKSEESLLPLYDRFPLKIITENIREKDNRIKLLKQKQSAAQYGPTCFFSVDELKQMQKEVCAVTIPDSINDTMDNILCDLRENGVFVSDRKFLEYSPVVQAKAWLDGRTEVILSDLMILKNYLWFLPKEIGIIASILDKNCINPLSSQLSEFEAMASEIENDFLDTYKDGAGMIDNAKTYKKFCSELRVLYERILPVKNNIDINNQANVESVEATISAIEAISKNVHKKVNFTYVPMEQLAIFN